VDVKPNELRVNILTRLQQIQPAIAAISGFTYYAIQNLDATGQPTPASTIQLVKRQGISTEIRSRCDAGTVPLLGTKRSVVQKAEIFIGLGGGDRRPILIIPIFSKNNMIEHELLLHIMFAEKITAPEAVGVVGPMYSDIQNDVTEANIPWGDDVLTKVSPATLCVCNPEEIAEKIIQTIQAQPK